MKKIITLIFLLISNISNADSLILHLGSYHMGNRWFDWNEVNPGIGYNTGKYTLGVLNNSIDKTSVYLQRNIHYKGLDYSVGMISGYITPISPQMFKPMVSATYGEHFLITFLPAFTPSIHFSYKINLN